jgi:hypothetical protein
VNARSAQVLAATLSALLIILVGATVFVILTRPPQQPTPNPSLPPPSPAGTLAAVISPSIPVA